MTEPFTLAPGRAALDVVDMQDDFVARPGATKPEERALHAPVVGTEGAR